jgi:4-hydroxysphinganine ceramide fatty acyl 2-hydroxylase
MPPAATEYEVRPTSGKTYANDGGVPEYGEQEVALHNTRKDAWVIYKDVVYNVSSFVEDHPGGPQILMDYAGKDITDVFHSIIPHDHSDAAVSILKEHKIGLLKDREFRLAKRSKTEEAMFTQADEPEVIDLEKPVVTQMWAARMPLKQYLRYTHTPHFLKGGRVARFFENPIMEFLSRNTWHAVLLWVPVVWYCFTVSAENHSPHMAAFLFAMGVFLWTLLEYSLHRFVFHLDERIPDYPIFVCGHFLLHGVHHFLPMDRLRLVMPPALALVIVQPLYWGLRLAFPHATTLGILSGGLTGYILYDLTHYYLHHGIPITSHLREMKSYHLNHHYKNYHLGYGISTKFWDRVFGTLLEVK